MDVLIFGITYLVVTGLFLGAYRLRDRFGIKVVAAVAFLLPIVNMVSLPYGALRLGQIYVGAPTAVIYAAGLSIPLYVLARDGLRAGRIVMLAALGAGVVAHGVRIGLDGGSLTHEIGSLVGRLGADYATYLVTMAMFAWIRKPDTSIRWSMVIAVATGLVFGTLTLIPVVDFARFDLPLFLRSSAAETTFASGAFGFVWGSHLKKHHHSETPAPGKLLEALLFTDAWTTIEEYAANLRSRAGRDELTGLGNRRSFDNMLDDMLAPDSDLHHGEFVLLEIKAVNLEDVADSLGPDIAETVIVSMADHIAATARPEAFAFRIDDAKFALLMPDFRRRMTRPIAERIARFSFSHPELDQPAGLHVDTAQFPDDGTSVQELSSSP